jgi:hypothetical protein
MVLAACGDPACTRLQATTGPPPRLSSSRDGSLGILAFVGCPAASVSPFFCIQADPNGRLGVRIRDALDAWHRQDRHPRTWRSGYARPTRATPGARPSRTRWCAAWRSRTPLRWSIWCTPRFARAGSTRGASFSTQRRRRSPRFSGCSCPMPTPPGAALSACAPVRRSIHLAPVSRGCRRTGSVTRWASSGPWVEERYVHVPLREKDTGTKLEALYAA